MAGRIHVSIPNIAVMTYSSVIFSERFGLYHIDFNSPNRTRTIKSSAKYYQQVLQTKCILPNGNCAVDESNEVPL